MATKQDKSRFKFSALIALMVVFVLLPDPSYSASIQGEGKNWKIKLSTKYIYDDNLTTTPRDSGNRPEGLVGYGDYGFDGNLKGSYKYNHNHKLNMNFEYNLNQVVYGSLSDYNRTTQMFGMGSIFKLNPLTNLQMNYKYIWNQVGGDPFSGIHFINPAFNYMHQKYGLTRIDYFFKNTQNWQNSFRDTVQHSFGIRQYVFFSNYSRRIKIGYKYGVDEATGPAFDLHYHKISLGTKSPIIQGIYLNAQIGLTLREYDNRVVTGEGDLRKDARQSYTIELSREILEKWKWLKGLTLKSKFNHVFNNTNHPTRIYKKNRYELTLIGRF